MSTDFGKNRARGLRHARTKHVRITRGQGKILRGNERREGEGKLGIDVLAPRKIHLSQPTDPNWRNLQISADTKLAHIK